MNILYLTILVVEIIIGFYFHLKKVQMVKLKKEFTWELEIYNSVVCVIHFTFITNLDVVEYVCPYMNGAATSITIHIFGFFRSLGWFIILLHSLNVALYKYYIIVIEMPVNYSDKKMELKWSISFICFSILLAIGCYLGNLETGGFAVKGVDLNKIKSCQAEDSENNETESKKGGIFCHFEDDEYYRENWPIFHILTKVYCVVMFIIRFILFSNILEGFIYYKIFRFSKR